MLPLPGLKRLRDEAALTQQDLASKAGVARSTIVDIESGTVSPRASTVRKIAKALGVQPRDLQRIPEQMLSAFDR